jgi:hypothetical protein
MSRAVVASGALLCIPVAFLVSAAVGHPAWPLVLGNPVLLLAIAGATSFLVLRPFCTLEVKGHSIQFSIARPPFANIAIIAVAVCIVIVLVGYGFVENFTAR